MSRRCLIAACGVVWILGCPLTSWAQTDPDDQGWFNATDLSLVLTGGNSAARTLGVSNTLRRVWAASRLQVDLSAVRSETADERFLLVDPGFQFSPGSAPEAFETTLVKPGTEPDVANYLVGARFDRTISERFFWNTGGSWDRNEDAGILNRYVLFAGVGNIWRDDETLQFSTTYGISYTDREEKQPDEDKDRRFGGALLGWDYLNRFGRVTVYENDFTANLNVANPSDYSLNMTNAVSAAMSDHLSLKVSLQWLYEHRPALEDINVVARVMVIDPDGVPGSGDELFETVANGGTETTVGTEPNRKDRLDTIFRTALVISF